MAVVVLLNLLSCSVKVYRTYPIPNPACPRRVLSESKSNGLTMAQSELCQSGKFSNVYIFWSDYRLVEVQMQYLFCDKQTFLFLVFTSNIIMIMWILSGLYFRLLLRGYCTSGPYFWRLCAFSQKIKQLWTKYPMDLVRNVPRNSKITVLLQWRPLLWSYSEKCAKINIFHVLSHKSIITWVSEIRVQ